MDEVNQLLICFMGFTATQSAAAPPINYVGPGPGTEQGSILKVTPVGSTHNNTPTPNMWETVGYSQPSSGRPGGRRSPTYDYALANVLTNPLTRTTDPDTVLENVPSDRLPVEPSK